MFGIMGGCPFEGKHVCWKLYFTGRYCFWMEIGVGVDLVGEKVEKSYSIESKWFSVH